MNSLIVENGKILNYTFKNCKNFQVQYFQLLTSFYYLKLGNINQLKRGMIIFFLRQLVGFGLGPAMYFASLGKCDF